MNDHRQQRQLVSIRFDGGYSPEEGFPEGGAAQPAEHHEAFRRQVSLLSTAMRGAPVLQKDIDAASARVAAHIERTIRVRPLQLPWWQRSLAVPTPLLATAAAVVILLASFTFATVFHGTGAPHHEVARGELVPDMPSFLGGDRPVNVQVTVDPSQTDQLLRWLNDHADSQQVTIQLPEQARFQFRGDPVMIRPERSGSSDARDLEIVPLEDEGE